MNLVVKYCTSILIVSVCTFITVNQNHLTTKPEDEVFRSCMLEKDCKLLAHAGYYESRSESDEGVVAVMHTILNRKADRRWGNTVREVLYQKWQFSYLWDGSTKKGFTEKENHRRIALLARAVLNGDIEDPTGGAHFYHTVDVSPRWNKSLTKLKVIDKHVFWR